MTIGELARRILGPLTDPVARIYRSYFVNLDDFARELSLLEDVAVLLEIGCGDGHLCQALAAAFPDAEVLGIDIAENPGTLYRGRSEGVEFRQMPAEELAMERAGQFDLVVLCDVLHHVPPGEREVLMDTARMLVAPGGHVAVKDWVAGRDLATVLAYLSDRFITGDRPRFFESEGELADLVMGDSAEVVAEGWVRPKRNNRYLLTQRPG